MKYQVRYKSPNMDMVGTWFDQIVDDVGLQELKDNVWVSDLSWGPLAGEGESSASPALKTGPQSENG